MPRYLPRRAFGLVLAVLAIGTVVGVAAVEILHHHTLVPVVVGVAVAIGVVYIVVFGEVVPEAEPPPAAPEASPPTPDPSASIPSPPATPSPAVIMEPYEPYYDPVEEADRLDSQKSRSELPASEGQDPK
jgi:hypothetical protein